MRVLIVTNLYPNEKQPQRGIFNKQQFDELKKLCDIKVIAPLPLGNPDGVRFFDTVDGVQVYHPYYLAIPVIGRDTHGKFFYWAIKKLIQKIYSEWKFDVILSTWVYPDAYAVSFIAKEMGVPFIVKVHGTDMNYGIQIAKRLAKMKKVFREAKAVIAVSNPLRDIIRRMEIDDKKIALLTNGVNGKLFFPQDQKECQKALGLKGDVKRVVYIGNLVEIKGAKYLIEAFSGMKENIYLHIIGDGVLRKDLEELVLKLQLMNRVTFHGKKPHNEIPRWLNAADLFCLPSENEGCPNVVLESLACGTPVVASKVGAVPDLIEQGKNGFYVTPKDPSALREAITQWIDVKEKKGAEYFSKSIMTWEDNAKELRKWL